MTRRASRTAITRAFVHHCGELIAYRAGWTDPERERPVGDTGRHEPRQADVITDAELERALTDTDPLRGIAQLTARWAAAFVLDPAGVTRTKALGTERRSASSATRCLGERTRFHAPCGSSFGRCSHPCSSR
jgi:hypothetical protein